jgi:hypothetical protein
MVVCSACRRLHPVDDGAATHVCTYCDVGEASLVWPPDRVEIDRLLAPRPAENRNWWPGVSTALLALENAAHGVGVGV